MKAAVRVEPRNIQIVDVSEPVACRGESVIRVETVSVCGGDLHYFQGPMPFSNAVPGMVDAPYIVCHEVVGIIADVASGSKWRVGDRVVVDPQERCGVCRACLRGDIELCPKRRDMGYSIDGVAAEYIRIPDERIHRAPEGVGGGEASATHGLAAPVHALQSVDLESVRSALVLGPGPAGLMFAMTLLAKLKTRDVRVGGRPSPRLDIVREIGAVPLELRSGAFDDYRFDWASDNGFDLVVDTTGARDVIEDALTCVAPRGTLLLYAPTGFEVDGNFVFRRELRITGSTGATGGIDEASELIASGAVPIGKILTHEFEFDAIQDAFELALAGPAARGDFLKGVVHVAA